MPSLIPSLLRCSFGSFGDILDFRLALRRAQSNRDERQENEKMETAANTQNIELPCEWPAIATLKMPTAQVCARRLGIGGSDANVILSENTERILELWEVKRGVRPEPDLSDTLPVVLGSWTEPFNRQWYERITGRTVGQAGAMFTCPTSRWRRVTVDGIVGETNALWEAKHTSAFAKPDEVLARYMPQLQHGMAVTGLENATLSVLYGNHRFEIYEVAADWLYQDALLAAEQHFWACVQSGAAPRALPAPPPPKPTVYREVCLQGNNSWAVAAYDWADTAEPARRHANAIAAIKGLIEDDVSRAYGHGIEAKRSKSGAITIRADRS